MASRKNSPRESPRLAITPLGMGGWAKIEWRAGEPDEIVAFVRFSADEDLLLHAAELRITPPWLHRHRNLPLSRIENAANADAETRWLLSQQPDYSLGDVDVADAFAMKAAISTRELPPRVYLERPAKRRLNDDFYRAVARAYAGAVAWGLDPRKTLAADSDTPADTVARWIREARRRGYLSSGEPGKASGVVPEETDG